MVVSEFIRVYSFYGKASQDGQGYLGRCNALTASPLERIGKV